MIQFILNNKPFSKTDREELIPYYEGLGCIEVPILYNDNFLKPIWNGSEFIESATATEISEAKRPLIEEIDRYYTNLIDIVLMKPMQKLARGVYSELPADVLQRVEELVLECNDKISALGVDVSVYRETKRETIVLKSL